MIWSAIGRAIYWTLGVIQGAGELVGAGRKLERAVREDTDDTDPIPLTHRQIELREAQIRCASRPDGLGGSAWMSERCSRRLACYDGWSR